MLAASSSATAKITCFSAAFVYLLFGIPPILLGAAVSSTGNKNDLLVNVCPTVHQCNGTLKNDGDGYEQRLCHMLAQD